MLMGPQRSQAWPYKVTVGSEELALSTDAVTNHLVLEYLTEAELERINGLIRAASSLFEAATRRTLITKTYETKRTQFPSGCGDIELLKSPFVSLVSFEFLVDGVYTAVPTDLYTIVEGIYYDSIVLNNYKQWPSTECAPNLVKIVFTAGVGADDEEICDSLLPWVQSALQGLLMHVAGLNENRGDCGGGCSGGAGVPNEVMAYYSPARIISLAIKSTT